MEIPLEQKESNTEMKMISAKLAASELRKSCFKEKVAFISVMIASFVCAIASMFNVWAACVSALFFSIYSLIFFIKAQNMEKYLTNKYGLEKVNFIPKIDIKEE